MAQGGKLHVKVDHVPFLGDSLVAIDSRHLRQQTPFAARDSVFEFDLEIDTPSEYYLVNKKQASNMERGFSPVRFQAMPDEQMLVKGAGEHSYSISGSKFYEECEQLSDLHHSLFRMEAELTDSILKLIMNPDTDKDSVREVHQRGMDSLQQIKDKVIMEYIADHSDSEASATLVKELSTSAVMKQAIALLSPKVSEGRAKGFYETELHQKEHSEYWKQQAKEKQAPGRTADDFTLKQITGEDLTLSSLRGQYVVLDFWGSWCGPCKRGMPQMKEYYQKYSGRFQIVGIACNDTDSKWRQAVEELQLPWLHVFNPKESTVENDYAITAFPTKIILDPEGRIIQSYIGETNRFYKKLDELFGK